MISRLLLLLRDLRRAPMSPYKARLTLLHQSKELQTRPPRLLYSSDELTKEGAD